ncbi:putative membrane protein [Smittium mucronatum]|uniref:Putative membrane protein n=1 Tax=Smittium mucronatum TaxID=133383 RepID=A0A1R0GUY4_9FUNG|nr:putative membrane protein [Smittium mucronatum]
MDKHAKNSILDEKLEFGSGSFESPHNSPFLPTNRNSNFISPNILLSNIPDSTIITISPSQDRLLPDSQMSENLSVESSTGFSDNSKRVRSTSVSRQTLSKKSSNTLSEKPKNTSRLDSDQHHDGKDSHSQLPSTKQPPSDFWNIVLLISLCNVSIFYPIFIFPNLQFFSLASLTVDWLQGVPLGLSSGSIPFLLKEKMSFSQLGLFSLASYPYSLKLFWSPIVDSIFSNRFGRRKSWIVPVQFAIAAIFWFFGSHVDELIKNPGPNITTISLIFFIIVLLSATQDIAVDGWALTLLSKENLAYASTCQTIGLNCGYFMSFTVFLAFNTVDFSNKYFRSVPKDYGLIQLGQYMRWWAVLYTIVTLYLVLRVKEKKFYDNIGIVSTYKTIYQICRLPDMVKLIIVLMFAKFGFVPNDSAMQLKLLEKGFKKEDMALAILIDFPIQITFGYYAARWSQTSTPMKPWRIAYISRIFFCFVGMLAVYFYPSSGSSGEGNYFYFILLVRISNSMASTVMFVGLSAFITRISDPIIGGTYMTLLNTLSNFGGTWPVYFVLESVDYFSKATCSVPQITDAGKVFFSCISESGKEMCADLGGKCIVQYDGFYIISVICLFFSILNFTFFSKPTISRLESLPLKAWRIATNIH